MCEVGWVSRFLVRGQERARTDVRGRVGFAVLGPRPGTSSHGCARSGGFRGLRAAGRNELARMCEVGWVSRSFGPRAGTTGSSQPTRRQKLLARLRCLLFFGGLAVQTHSAEVQAGWVGLAVAGGPTREVVPHYRPRTFRARSWCLMAILAPNTRFLCLRASALRRFCATTRLNLHYGRAAARCVRVGGACGAA
jgi:hypothetical protein